ncbi:phosphate ABC transporter substrate-binding protein [Paraconexibacter algicola]|uniref:Phosphate ABC transporter substrate-binding protein n=1 Tax=Paraconexibacter algicola TaxID=2133960 RepID=A0A2T4UN24_9ACTN|nr:phosphate ABC transporter substrate-binding protein [Paraconexibacter algicola]
MRRGTLERHRRSGVNDWGSSGEATHRIADVHQFFSRRPPVVHDRHPGPSQTSAAVPPGAPSPVRAVRSSHPAPSPVRRRSHRTVRRPLPAVLLATAACAVPAAVVPATAPAAKPKITMSGSTSIKPLAKKLIQGYLKAFPGAAQFSLLQGGSDIGVTDVAKGRVSIGNVSRDPVRSDPGGLVFNKIARDGLCIVTNRKNPLPNLSQADVQAIFSGKVKRWEDVPGSTVTGIISLYARTPSSGTQDAFQNIFMGQNLRVSAGAQQKKETGLVQQAVASDERGIGYLTFEATAGTHAVPYKGVACTLRNAKAETYPGVRNFWMVTRGKATGATGKFLRWVKGNAAAQRIIASEWVPLKAGA